MNKSLISFYKKRIFYALTHPLFYICALVFNIFSSGLFFLTGRFFTGLSQTSLNTFFNTLPYLSIFIIPLLCMDPFTEYEKTLPFSKIENEIVKLFSSVTLFVLILLPALFVPVCVNLFGFVEGAEVFTGILFMILFSFSSAALCLFFQSIIENSLISLIFSVLFNVFFNFIHFFALSLNSSAVISKIVKSLSFSWHFNSAKKGIFDSRDCLFFILFTVSCLLLNVYTSEIKKGKHFSKHRKQNAFLLSVILVFSFLNSTKYYFRKDFTLRKNYSLTSYSKKLLNENSSRLNITYFRNRELENLYPSVKDITDLLNEYAENPNVSVSVRDPVRKNEVQLLSNYQIYPRQIQQSRNGKTELINVYSCIFLEMNGKTEVIPFILSSKNLEFSVSEKLLKLISDNKRYVNILSGSGENVSENYSYLIEFLNSQGFSVNIIDNNFEIPSQLEAASEFGSLLLVLGHSNLSDSDTAAIETYLEKGNKIFFAVSPYEKDINETWHITKSKNQKLIRLIESYGIGFSKNIIKDLSSARILMQDENNNSTYLNYYLWPEILPQENAKNGMTLFWPVNLEFHSENFTEVLKSSRFSSEMKPDENSKDSLFETNPFLIQNDSFSSQNDKEFVFAARYKGSAYGYYNPGSFDDIQFELISDQYFCSSLMLGYIGGEYGDYRNLDFLTAELFKLNGEAELSKLYEKALDKNNGFYKTPDEESFIKAKNITLTMNFIIVPLIFMILCVSMIFIRKNRK